MKIILEYKSNEIDKLQLIKEDGMYDIISIDEEGISDAVYIDPTYYLEDAKRDFFEIIKQLDIGTDYSYISI